MNKNVGSNNAAFLEMERGKYKKRSDFVLEMPYYLPNNMKVDVECMVTEV